MSLFLEFYNIYYFIVRNLKINTYLTFYVNYCIIKSDETLVKLHVFIKVEHLI